ncbi:MAG: class I SAM-dependent methyltransferase [Eubacteriales bacterium]|nr:class I SAM-dependent methyltransferase [Eubacteriales bacterium]
MKYLDMYTETYGERTVTEDGQPRTAAKKVPLSRRLEAIVDLAESGNVVCDVGCDHAHVPIRLLQEGRFRSAIGMDVLPGPLGKAAGNLKRYGMEDRVALRQSDGLDMLVPGEADTIVITGMGGTLMREILLREPAVTRSAGTLVLGPQSDPGLVRSALRSLGFRIAEEKLVFEDGKYYPVLRAVRSENSSEYIPLTPDLPAGVCREAEDLFGPVLLRRRDPVLLEYLVRKTASLKRVYRSVCRAAEEQPEAHSARRAEIEHSLAVYSAGLRVYGR